VISHEVHLELTPGKKGNADEGYLLSINQVTAFGKGPELEGIR
jgi:hypothetical protein